MMRPDKQEEEDMQQQQKTFQDKLNTATKYDSIETYHALGGKGILTEDLTFPEIVQGGEAVFGTEKVNGTNARLIKLYTGDWFIGARESLFTARLDRVPNTGHRIVEALSELAERLPSPAQPGIAQVLFLEVYGGTIGSSWREYTSGDSLGYRLFDLASFELGILRDRSLEQVSSWRQHGGRNFLSVTALKAYGEKFNVPLVPYFPVLSGHHLPLTVQHMHEYLSNVSVSQVNLDGSGRGTSEGLVFRTESRSFIAKARLEDYQRTMDKRTGDDRPRPGKRR